jgi:hypothetical protein
MGKFLYRGVHDLRVYVLVDVDAGLLSIFVQLVFPFLSDIIIGVMLQAGL